jgi:septum site-determining protein MinD
MNCRTVTIFGNKGGVGKTFVAVNIATALAMGGRKVLLLDLDLYAASDMARMLNLGPKFGIVHLIPELEKTESPDIIKKFAMSHSSGLDFLPAITEVAHQGHVTADNIKPFFRAAADFYEYIIVDAGKIFSETMVTVLDNSNLILLIGTPDVLAVYQLKWGLDMLQELHFPLKMVRLVLNRSESRGGVAWQEVRTALSCEILAHVPSDGHVVGVALNKGVPVVEDAPRSKVSEAFRKIANDLKNDDLYVQSMDVKKERSVQGLDKPGKFWEKFGITSQNAPVLSESFLKEEDEQTALKRKIHEKLVERLHVEDLTPEILSDPKKAKEIKENARKIVSALLLEEKGAMISSHEERTRIVREIVDEALGLGALEDFLADPDVSDIMVNNKDELYVEKKGKLVLTGRKFVSNQQMRSIIDRIVAPLGRRIDESVPMVDARLPDGSRFNAIIPPLSLGGPMLTIRKFGKERLTVEDLLNKFHSFSQPISDFLHACVLGRKNIIVSGGTGAGKTTLLNVISQFIPDGERIITIEDAAELQLKKSHWARLESRPSNVEGKGAVTIRDLFVNTLRMRPDRIIIGECRGPEILDMLQAMNTGHDGSMTTLHANSTRDVITRMSSMILLSGIELPMRAITEMIASAIDVIVHIARFPDGSRKITGVTEVVGLDQEYQLLLKDIFVFAQRGKSEEGRVMGDFVSPGYVPTFFDEFITMGIKLDRSVFEKRDAPG